MENEKSLDALKKEAENISEDALNGVSGGNFTEDSTLKNKPELLPPQTLAEETYSNMFVNTNLTKAPKLPPMSLEKENYNGKEHN